TRVNVYLTSKDLQQRTLRDVPQQASHAPQPGKAQVPGRVAPRWCWVRATPADNSWSGGSPAAREERRKLLSQRHGFFCILLRYGRESVADVVFASLAQAGADTPFVGGKAGGNSCWLFHPGAAMCLGRWCGFLTIWPA